MRKNSGKPKLTKAMLMPTALHALVDVLEFGEQKYDPVYNKGWLKYDKKEVLDSMLRHCVALINNECKDPESHLPHAAHMLFNAAVYVELTAKTYYSSEDSSAPKPPEDSTDD